jgi:hypothetical protein
LVCNSHGHNWQSIQIPWQVETCKLVTSTLKDWRWTLDHIVLQHFLNTNFKTRCSVNCDLFAQPVEDHMLLQQTGSRLLYTPAESQ